MYPPTPTPLPPGIQQVAIDQTQWRIWQFTDEAIQLWHMAPNSATTALQIAIIILLALGVLFMLYIWLKKLTANESMAE